MNEITVHTLSSTPVGLEGHEISESEFNSARREFNLNQVAFVKVCDNTINRCYSLFHSSNNNEGSTTILAIIESDAESYVMLSKTFHEVYELDYALEYIAGVIRDMC